MLAIVAAGAGARVALIYRRETSHLLRRPDRPTALTLDAQPQHPRARRARPRGTPGPTRFSTSSLLS